MMGILEFWDGTGGLGVSLESVGTALRGWGAGGTTDGSTQPSLFSQYILEIDITCWDADPVPEEEEGYEGGD